MLLLILLPMEVDAFMQEKRYERNTVGIVGSNNGKVILILLTKVITFI